MDPESVRRALDATYGPDSEEFLALARQEFAWARAQGPSPDVAHRLAGTVGLLGDGGLGRRLCQASVHGMDHTLWRDVLALGQAVA